MAGRIRDEDVAEVRERARIDDIVREYVTLKPAGGGSMKGLCPFHDERSPSFHVTPSRGMWYCFGCGEGGDLIGFIQKIDHLSFAEAVEKLADKVGITLQYVDGGVTPNKQQGQRKRLVEAHKRAAAFYQQQLASPEAETGRNFLTERGFDANAAQTFGVGYAPQGWDALTKHLKEHGFTETELLAGGLVSQGNRGVYDRFRGRLVWPIRDLGGEVIGFGARKLYDDDEGPKYLNTPETPIYKKSSVLYGLDIARKEVSKEQTAVIVEGYTDVMAAHLAGVGTAVATCGTAFGAEHIKVLRRLLMDDDRMRGHVIFTFDGDAAGQKAALRAFEEDQRFVSQTFVAVEKSGLDPCDLRLQHGDAAVRALIENKVPLFEFAIKSVISHYDLNTSEGRIAALNESAPIVAKIRDTSLRPEYSRRLAGWLGMDPATVSKAVGGRNSQPVATKRPALGASVEREALKGALQYPAAVSDWFSSVESTAFTHDKALAVFTAIVAAGGPSSEVGGMRWIDAVLAAAPDDDIRSTIRELAVEPMPAEAGTDERYAVGMIAKLLEMDSAQRIEELRGQLTRAEESGESSEIMEQLFALESYRRNLRDIALGES
ncbi:MAG: DNA primase [Candidatus Nanopelagicales bacterium]|nr:DNA primase [Candidatus Nanopelagicales bacterium]MCF8539620.1 DNA primase [Candidatus Nanopelagicales bacterium]MCF8551318.1 DNA primase [Candidatus Nanopelagicales bacterium]